MKKPTITTIDGKTHEMINLTGRTYRVVAEFEKNAPDIADVDYIERHAALIAELYDGVTVDDVLDMPLEDIIPASLAARKVAYSFTWLKMQEITKNVEADKEQSA